MKYAFDEIIERRGTDAIKHDFAEKRGMPESLLPLWVADMDFLSPPEVIEALENRARHGVFGYSGTAGEEYFEALHHWYATRFGWEISPDWLVKTTGIVFSVSTAIRALTKENDAVLIQPPVYYPFEISIYGNGRRVVHNQLAFQDGKYGLDLEDFEQKIVEQGVKLFILCSPHNPVGRVWTREELTAMGDICVKHGVLVLSDEIHCDFVFPGHRHQVFAAIKPEFAELALTCTAPSKTFNLAGLQTSNIFIANPELRERFRAEIAQMGLGDPNLMGLVACRAAYTYGAPWLEALIDYLLGNLALVRDFLKEKLPQIRLVEPEGTYLVWLDCRGLGLSDEALDQLMVEKAGLWLDGGSMFGAGGKGFQRVNIASPRGVIFEALERLEKAVDFLEI